jgi:hypothetical protein
MGIAGNLKTMELSELLQWLSQGLKTGTLVVTHDFVEKRIFFEKGKIISSGSSDPKEHLGHFLVSHGFITEQQLAQAVRRQEAEKSMLGKVLVEMGAINAEQLDHMLRMKAEEGIYSLFSWPEGDFRFLDDELPPYRMVPISLDVTGLVLEAMRRQDEWQRIKERIPSPLCVPVRVVDDLLGLPDLEEGQRVVLGAIDDHRTIEEIALETHASDYYVCETIFPLVTARKVKIVRPRGHAAAAAKAAEAQGPVAGMSLLTLGQQHLDKGELEGALRYFRAARSLDPDNGTIQLVSEQAERTIRQMLKKEGVVLDAVPRLIRGLDQITSTKVSAKAGFLLSRIDGSYDIASILKISPMSQLEALLVFRELAKAGLVRLERRKDAPSKSQ